MQREANKFEENKENQDTSGRKAKKRKIKSKTSKIQSNTSKGKANKGQGTST